MWNCQSFLCLVVIDSSDVAIVECLSQQLILLLNSGLVTRGVSSMNEQPRVKNDSQKMRENDPILSLNTNSDDKRSQHDELAVKNADQLFANSTAIATADVATNSTSFNGTVALVNAARLGSREQSHSKRHFHRSKSYRKEARTKSRASLSKTNVGSGNLIPFSFEHVVGGNVAFQNLFHGPNHNSDSIKLVHATPKTSGTSLSKVHAVSTNRDDSISKTSSRSLSGGRSKDPYDKKLDKLSSRFTASSGSIGNWDNSSSTSDAGSLIDEKLSSVELMTFTFDNVEEVRQSTLPNEIIKRGENVTASTLISTDNSSSTTTVDTSDKSIDKPKSTSAEVNYGAIDRDRSIRSSGNDFDDDLVIYSVHTETSREAERLPNELSSSGGRDRHNMTQNDSIILGSVVSESSKNSRNTFSKLGKTDDKSASMNLENNSNHSRPSADGHSWVSLDDSLNRLSLTAVADNLNNLNSHVARASYSYSNSTLSQDSRAASESEMKIPDIGASSVKHSRSLTVPEVQKSTRELRSSKSSDSDVKSSDRSYPSPVSSVTENIEHPSKIIGPLNIAAIVKNGTKNYSLEENFELPRRSIPGALFSMKRSPGLKDVESKDEPFRLVLDLKPSSSRCSSNSSTERLQNVQSDDRETLFYQRRRDHATVSVSGKNISESAQCLTRFSLPKTSVNTTHEPETSMESLVFPTISANSVTEELGTSVSANKSNEIEAEDSESSPLEFDAHRGAQSLLSSGIIILENFEPVIQEALAPEETAVVIETETTTSGHFFAMFADPEEHCNASLFDIFIPSVNSRDSKAKVIPVEESPLVRREPQKLNVTTTEDSLYIMEGFGFLENNADEVSELEEDFDRRREVSSDYGETETYLGYPQLDDHPSAFKLINPIEFETKLPVKEDPLIVTSLRWKGNVGDHNNNPWWLNYDDKKRRRHQTVNNDDFNQEPVLIPSGFAIPQEIHAIPSLVDNVKSQMNESDNSSYHIFLLPTVYVFIGICVVVVGCNIWCSRVSLKRQSNVPKLTYFIQQRQESTGAVV